MALPKHIKETMYLVRGKDAGHAVWHYVAVDKLKLPLFLEAMKSGMVDVSQYGKIVHSGWGDNPPKAIADSMQA